MYDPIVDLEINSLLLLALLNLSAPNAVVGNVSKIGPTAISDVL